MTLAVRMCLACNTDYEERCEEGTCYACQCSQEACELLLSHGLDPEGIHDFLCRRTKYYGLTINDAKLIIEVFRTKHDRPN